MKKTNIVEYIRNNCNRYSKTEMATHLGITRDKVRRLMQQHKISGEKTLDADIEHIHFEKDQNDIRKKFRELLNRYEISEKEKQALLEIKKTARPHVIKTRNSKGTGEATAVIVASDWHIEEEVAFSAVNGRNEFNLDIARARIDEFFSHSLKLLKKEQGAIKIDNVILALLGDFISGNIHEELLESCSLRPIEAILTANSGYWSRS